MLGLDREGEFEDGDDQQAGDEGLVAARYDDLAGDERALIARARANRALIAEDDYDGEFRYDVAPLPALFGLDPEVVI